MKQLTFFKSFFLLCALMVGSSVWADDIEASFTVTGLSSVPSSFASSPTGFTMSVAANGGTNPAQNNGSLRLYCKNQMTIASVDGTTKFKSVTFNMKINASSGKYPLISAPSGSFSPEVTDNKATTTTWTADGDGVTTITFTFPANGTSVGGNWTFSAVSLTYEEAPSYTITPSVNETTMGSATLSGNIITATPNSGYRVSTTAPYTIIEGAANVTNITQNGNQFTVAATGDCTIQINFEAIPTHTLSSDVSPAGAGTVTFDSSTVAEGSSTTANASANAGYKFTGWSISGTGATLSSTTDNPTTVTMGTADATVTATFEAVTTYAIKWSVNGTVVQTDNVEENTAIAFPTSITGIPDGYVLKGWVTETNKISGTQATDPTYVTEATSTENITYYAVMAVEVATPLSFNKYEKVTEEQDDWSGTYLLAATYSGGSNEDLKGTFVYSAPASSEKYGERVALTPGTTEYTDYEIIIEGSANGYTIYHNNSKKYFGYNGSNNELNFYDEVSGKKQEWTITDVAVIKNAQSTSRILKYNGSSPRFACYTSGQTAVDLYKRIETGGTSYSNFCTTVPTATVTIAAACNDGKGVYYGTYSNASAFVVPDDMTVSAVSVDGDGKLVVTPFDEGDIVKAGTGVMVSSTTSGAHTITLATGGTDIDGNMLKGSGDAVISASDMSTAAPSCLYYRLTMHGYVENVNPGVIGFYWGAADGASFAIAANKAYLAVPEAQAAKMSGFAFDDTTTGINGVEEIAPVTKTRKVVKNGRLVIETANGEFTIDGARMK